MKYTIELEGNVNRSALQMRIRDMIEKQYPEVKNIRLKEYSLNQELSDLYTALDSANKILYPAPIGEEVTTFFLHLITDLPKATLYDEYHYYEKYILKIEDRTFHTFDLDFGYETFPVESLYLNPYEAQEVLSYNWIKTDHRQWGREVGPLTWEYTEVRSPYPPNHFRHNEDQRLFSATIDLTKYSQEEMIKACETFGYGEEQVEQWLEEQDVQIICECIFESQ